MRLSPLLVLPVVAAALAVPEAAAAGTGSTSSGNGVLYDVCRGHGWSATVDPDEKAWRLDVTVVDPQGSIYTTEVVTGDTDESVAVEGLWTFCGAEPVGVYTVQSTLTEFLPNGDPASTTQFADDTFRMRKPRSRTALTVSDRTPHFNEVVRFRATSTKERPSRFARAPYAVTKLQYKTPRGWKTLRGSKRTANVKGVTVWKYYWNVTNTYRVRAVTLSNGSYRTSSSGAKKVDQTAGGRVVARSASRPGAAWAD